MTNLSQARRLLCSAAFSATILLIAAPAALADPAGGYLTADVQPAAPAVVELDNAPAPGPEFLSSPHAWDELGGSSQTAPAAASGQGSGGLTNVAQ